MDSNDTIINVQSSSITTNFFKFKLSTDFRDYSSLAELQAVWWTNEYRMSSSSWTISIWYWSTWLKLYNGWFWWIYWTLPFNITWNNKIHIKVTGNWNSNSAQYSNLSTTTAVDLTNSNMTELSMRIPFAWKQSLWVTFNKSVSWTKYWEQDFIWNKNLNWTNWDFSIECDIDLTTNAIQLICSSPSSSAMTLSWTLNTNWRNDLIWTKYFFVWFANYSSATNYIYTYELKIK